MFGKSLESMIREARSRDLLSAPEQEDLTKRLVLPAMRQIVEAAGLARKRCDDIFRLRARGCSESKAALVAGEPSLEIYPVGFCEAIRDRVFDELRSEPLLQSFQRAGVVFKKVFVILEGMHFQNAIQIGNLFLDAANDALDPTEPCLEWRFICELNYTNLDSLDSIAMTAEQYYQCRVFPNLCFPLLAPFVPLFAVRDNGRLDLLEFQNIFFLKDLGDGLRRLRSWLSSSSGVLRQRLPQPYENALREHFSSNDFNVFPFEFRPCSPRHIADQARQIALAAKNHAQEHLVLTLLNLVPRASSVMRSRQIQLPF